MRRTILLNFFVLLIVFAAHQACAQRNGGSGQGRGFAGGGRGFSGGGHEFRGNRGGREFHHDRGNRNFNRNWGGYPYGYGYGYGYLPPYDDGYMPDDFNNNESYEPAPPDYDQQPSQPVEPPPPPVAEKPSHPFVKEYKWPAPGQPGSSAPPASESEPQNFAIVLKNGSTLSATMVLASANTLHYVDTDGKLQRVDIAEVDRAATLKLDRARNLNIYLPAAQ
jgi:hypothetical protein